MIFIMEKLIVDQKRDIINSIVEELTKTQPDLYYTDTSTIASIVKDYIHENKLPKEKYELVKDMDFRDIGILMSFTSDQV